MTMMGIPLTRVTGYTYDADYHCVQCAAERFGTDDYGFIPESATDTEGNPIGAIFPDSDMGGKVRQCGSGDHLFCGECGIVSGPYPNESWEPSWEDGRFLYRCPNCGATSLDDDDPTPTEPAPGMSVPDMWDTLRDDAGVCEQTLQVVTNINGYSQETMEAILYAVTGYRSFDQLAGERED